MSTQSSMSFQKTEFLNSLLMMTDCELRILDNRIISSSAFSPLCALAYCFFMVDIRICLMILTVKSYLDFDSVTSSFSFISEVVMFSRNFLPASSFSNS